MAVFLPLASYFLMVVGFLSYRRDLRTAMVLAAILWGCLVYAITEILGAGHILTGEGVSIAWIAALLINIFWLFRRAPAQLFSGFRGKDKRPLGVSQKIWLVAITVIILLVALTAISSPPNTWDVIDYHLARVAMWISNRSVGFFPTLDYGQLINSPWAEYGIMHFDLLWGSDRPVNLVESAGLVGTVIVASLIARELGADARGQIFAALMCATIPSSILEASGAMNTLVVAFWISAAIYCLMVFGKEPTCYVLAAASAACGLAVLTKGTAYVLLPGMVAACWWLGTREARKRFVALVPVLFLIVASLNAPTWYRNAQLTGSPLGSGEGLLKGGQGTQLANGRFSIGGTAANVVRNVALQATFASGVDSYVQRISMRIIRTIGQDPNDHDFIWRTTSEATPEQFRTNPPNRHEAFAGNPLHLLLIIVACVMTFVSRQARRNRVIFAAGLVGSFLLFCALLRWQIWGARYQLPLFVLGCALAGGVLPDYFGSAITAVLAWILIFAAMPYALSNELRPIAFRHLSPLNWSHESYAGSVWGRTRNSLYFADQHSDLEQSYTAAADAVLRSGCGDVGLDDSIEHYEYPVMALLQVSSGERRVRYTGVYNSSSKYMVDQPPPCAVICFACARVPHKWHEYRAVGGRVSVFGDVALFAKDGDKINAVSFPAVPDSHELALVIEEMRRNFLELLDFTYKNESARGTAYLNALRERPETAATLDKYQRAAARPIDDANRVWEMTGPLRMIAAHGPLVVDVGPLIDGSEALRNFVVDAPKAARDFDDFIAHPALGQRRADIRR